MSALKGPTLLFCPADRPDRYAKAAARADSIVLDLEDAVAPADKDGARQSVVRALLELDPAHTFVRINALDTPWGKDDLAALPAHTMVMLPKAGSAADVRACAPRAVLALCETAAGVLAAESLARTDNCAGLMWGGEDLIADLGGRSSRGPGGGYRGVVLHTRTQVLLAATAAHKYAVDAVHLDISDLEGLAVEAEDAVAVGFRAKACIHPSHVAPIRAAFAPTEAESRWAREVLAAAEIRGAVFRHGGRMVDAPVLAHARSVLAALESADDEPPSVAGNHTAHHTRK
ncbi:HpcH/HpaI aldolase/citrate lyase family protein [Streptomyces sp. NBC_00483]|uniref:HpcH/HpaI aldolase/citrate lyase family protein n=1 Tax=Streptomyces sp. NBC_00483 TaxID=2975756 RepID=UPI002E178EE0